jgi:hypothetical protein
MIPDEIGFFENTVNEIQLSVNQLTGTIPSEIGLLSLLFFFDVSYNKLTGTIPEEIYHQESDLDNIIVLGNMISGTISTRIGQLNNLKLFNGARNIFDGTLPTQIGNVTPLGTILFISFLRRLNKRKVNLLFISFALF